MPQSSNGSYVVLSFCKTCTERDMGTRIVRGQSCGHPQRVNRLSHTTRLFLSETEPQMGIGPVAPKFSCDGKLADCQLVIGGFLEEVHLTETEMRRRDARTKFDRKGETSPRIVVIAPHQLLLSFSIEFLGLRRQFTHRR